jgi:arabinan endo-1,5-alpha-L-arabinosidase
MSVKRRLASAFLTLAALLSVQVATPAPAHAETWYTIVNVASGNCLDHSDFGSGLYAYVYACHGYNNQKWILEPHGSDYRIRNVSSGKCLDHSDFGEGLYAYVYDCTGLRNQLWSWRGTYIDGSVYVDYFVNVYSGKCLDHSSFGQGLYAYVYTCTLTRNQLWHVNFA